MSDRADDMSRELADFNSLMDLAEEVAGGMERLRRQLGRLGFLYLSSALIAVGGFLSLFFSIAFRERLLDYAFTLFLTIGVLGSALAPLGALWALRERKQAYGKLDSEHRIMDEVAGTAAALLDRISAEEVGVVRYTVAQLRLRRLSLSGQ